MPKGSTEGGHGWKQIRCIQLKEDFLIFLFPFPGYRKLAEAFESDLYLEGTVANLLEKETGLCGKAYRQVAFQYKMKDIDRLERCKNPGKDVLDSLKSTQPDLTVYHFCKVLKGENIRPGVDTD